MSETSTPDSVEYPFVAVVKYPSLKDLLAIAGNNQKVTVGRVHGVWRNGGIEDGYRSEMELQSIRDITYDSEEDEYSFTGEHSYSYEQTSYNQTSTRTVRSWFRVRVHGKSCWMHRINNPHPNYRTW